MSVRSKTLEKLRNASNVNMKLYNWVMNVNEDEKENIQVADFLEKLLKGEQEGTGEEKEQIEEVTKKMGANLVSKVEERFGKTALEDVNPPIDAVNFLLNEPQLKASI